MLRDRCARLVRDAAAIGARWCEIARDAARSVRDGVRSVRVPRNLVSVRDCHVTCTDTHITHRWRKEAAQTKCTLRKNAQGSARGQCPVVLYERKGGREQQDGGRAEKRSGQKAAGSRGPKQAKEISLFIIDSSNLPATGQEAFDP